MEKKKFISFFLCFSLLAALTLSPAAAFAAETAPPESTQAEAAQESVIQAEAPSEPQAAEPSPEQSAEAGSLPAAEPAEAASSPSSENQTDTPQQAENSTAQTAQTTDEGQQEAAELQAEQAKQQDSPQEMADAAAAKVSAPPAKNTASAEKTVNGIKVTGGIEGKDWVYDSKEQTLTISKNGMTVSGTATDNLIILCTLAVSALTLDNLDHGKSEIQIVSGMTESDKTHLTLTLKGTSEIDAVIGAGDVTVAGSKDSRLDLTAGMTAFNDLNIQNATVTGGIFAADRDINITGTSRVTVRPTKQLAPALELGLPVAMMTAGRNINIDLAPGGKVAVSGMKTADAEVVPMLAMGKIRISESSKVVLPRNGKVVTSDLFDILPVQIIADASGRPASDVVVEHASARNSASGIYAYAASGDGTASPQTGDSSAHMLFALYLILAAAGSLAAALRMNKGHVRNEIMQ